MILPNLIWIFLDRGLWVSDTAQYGFTTLELHHLLVHDPSRWIQAALSIGPKPPIVPWIGEFLVPLGQLAGNVDFGLLLLPFLSQAMALILLFETLFEYSHSRLLAITGCAGAASAPLFIEVSKQLYVQPVQLAAVCWFLYIMARSKRWDALVIVLQLSAATSFAMLTTMSSPAFCSIPGGVALVQALLKLKRGRMRLEARHAYHLALAGPLSVIALAWYHRNVLDAIDYGSFSFNYPYGGLLGADYLEKLRTWTSFLSQFGLVTNVTLLLLLGMPVLLPRIRRSGGEPIVAPLLVGILQTVLALVTLASSEHQTLRYPLPILGFVVLVLGVCLANVDRRWLTSTILAALVVQLGVSNLVAFGRVERDWWDLRPIQTHPPRAIELLDAIHRATADAEGEVVLSTSGLGIYSFQVMYHAAKKPGGFRAAGPEYTSAEFVLTHPDVAADVDLAWRRITSSAPVYFVVSSDAVRSAQSERWRGTRDSWSAIMQGAVAISERVVGDVGYRLQPLPDYPEIEVYRRVAGE
jgi:hypothetical protein